MNEVAVSLTPRDALDVLESGVSAMPGGATREGQREMCAAVASAIHEGPHLVVSAGTGTGKSLAYLAPAVLASGRVVVATATKALQDQLLNQDIPQLAAAIQRPIAAATLKGRSNYICRQKIREMRDAVTHIQPTLLEGTSQKSSSQPIGTTGVGTFRHADPEVDSLVRWAKHTTSGDRADLSFEPSAAAWNAVSVTSRECPGRHACPSGATCFAEQAKAKAERAEVLVVNMHLYCLHSSGVPILPSHNVVILDEAHELEHIVSSVVGVSLSPRRMTNLLTKIAPHLSDDLMEKLKIGQREVFALVGQYDKELIPLPIPEDLYEASSQTHTALIAAEHQLERQISIASDTLAKMGATGDEDADQELAEQNAEMQRTQNAIQQKVRLKQSVHALREDLGKLGSPRDGWACWGERHEGTVWWCSSPVDVSDHLRETIWTQTTAILSSATIPLNYADAWGLNTELHDMIDVGSPFAYSNNAVLYCAEDIPRPGDPGYEEGLHREMEALMLAAGGRTLALFTSYQAMDTAARVLRARMPWPILTQRDLPKPELVRQFAAESECSLFATVSMWQGIDVPGESLSLVVIARLPFPRPDDPLIKARREQHGKRAFMDVDVPIAAIRLAQGAGRLIRRETDQGVVAVLDSRLANARYGWRLAKALSPYRRVKYRTEAESFLEACTSASVLK